MFGTMAENNPNLQYAPAVNAPPSQGAARQGVPGGVPYAASAGAPPPQGMFGTMAPSAPTATVMYAAPYPGAAGAASSSQALRTPQPQPQAPGGSSSMQRLQQVLQRFEITIAEANDMVALSDYEIVVICDDSGSMGIAAAPPSMRVLGQQARTRWEELKETVAEIVEIATCFDENGIEVHFLNRPSVYGVRSSMDPAFAAAFAPPPSGTTPLTEAMQRVAAATRGERPVLLFVFTDGEPNGGSERFKKALRQLVADGRLRIQIMACTSNDDEIGWLNEVDAELSKVDVTDDYYTERQEVLRTGLATKFTRGDWCMKAMLGPIIRKFDQWDETMGRKKAPPSCNPDTCAVM